MINVVVLEGRELLRREFEHFLFEELIWPEQANALIYFTGCYVTLFFSEELSSIIGWPIKDYRGWHFWEDASSFGEQLKFSHLP